LGILDGSFIEEDVAAAAHLDAAPSPLWNAQLRVVARNFDNGLGGSESEAHVVRDLASLPESEKERYTFVEWLNCFNVEPVILSDLDQVATVAAVKKLNPHLIEVR